MSDHIVFLVEVACIFAVGDFDRLMQRIFTFGDGDMMYMICHKRICPDERPISLARFTHEAQIDETIRIIQENVLFAIAPMKDVVRATWHGYARKFHEMFLGGLGRAVAAYAEGMYSSTQKTWGTVA